MAIPFEDFTAREIDGEGARIFVRHAGDGPALLLLHGFPETHLMWRDIAPSLAERFTVVCADLRGYGRSACPPSTPDHGAYSKRTMARDMVAVMAALGFPRFALAGHDRGGRVGYRLALDHPDQITHLAVLDVVPTADAFDRANADFALGFWPWVLLSQDQPLPERLIAGAPDAVIDAALGGWGSPAGAFPREVRAAYVDALSDPAHIHAICEEYRAAASLDRAHDASDRVAGRRISCPVLALWSEHGPLDSWYEAEGGPLMLWRRWAQNVTGAPVPGGHFFPEELPDRTAEALIDFLA